MERWWAQSRYVWDWVSVGNSASVQGWVIARPPTGPSWARDGANDEVLRVLYSLLVIYSNSKLTSEDHYQYPKNHSVSYTQTLEKTI